MARLTTLSRSVAGSVVIVTGAANRRRWRT
jgi:hypothetical protein